MSAIYSAGTALPQFCHRQADIYEFMQLQVNTDSMIRILRSIYNNGLIEKRYSVLPDYNCPAEQRIFYPAAKNLEPFPLLEKRLALYDLHAPVLAVQAAKDCFSRFDDDIVPTHIISVSCTGMSAPGIDIAIVQKLGLAESTYRTSVNFMGCYGVFHALKMADAICKSEPEAAVLIISVELCTLHFQKEETTDNMLSNSLFGDGAGALLIAGDERFESKKIKINSFYSMLSTSGEKDMAWNIAGSGFRMTLNPQVPELVANGLIRMKMHLPRYIFNGSAEDTLWAIHPGGKKILENASLALGINSEKMNASFSVLKNYGNMSSASIIFVLKEMWDNEIDWQKEETIFSAGFGPGLTIESALLKTFA